MTASVAKSGVNLYRSGNGVSIKSHNGSMEFNLGELDEKIESLQKEQGDFTPVIDLSSKPIQVYDKRDLEVDQANKDERSSKTYMFMCVFPSQKEDGRLLMYYNCLRKEAVGHFPGCDLSDITVKVSRYQDGARLLTVSQA